MTYIISLIIARNANKEFMKMAVFLMGKYICIPNENQQNCELHSILIIKSLNVK